MYRFDGYREEWGGLYGLAKVYLKHCTGWAGTSTK